MYFILAHSAPCIVYVDDILIVVSYFMCMSLKRKFITLCFGEYRYVALQRVLSAHYRIEPFECSSGTRIAAINDWAVRAVEDAYIAYPLGE